MKKIAMFAGAAILAVSMSSCAKMTEPFKDAPRGATNDAPGDLVTFPDGFSNVATKCDHGNRIYTAYHADKAYAAIAVVPNAEDC